MADSDDLRGEFNKLKSDMERLRSDIGDLSGALRGSATNRARNARAGVSAELHHARDAFQNRTRAVRARGQRARHNTEMELAEHPFIAILAAFGLGAIVAALVGFAARRARRRRELDIEIE